ncbi:MAG: hypothetical protein E5Y55_24100 [Mesorhizobium sp.]|uniref:hypothetical protein n=1 Tax=Mesorhizobium sp. TaxID=1871066 RepID=UPI001220B8F4|nr:hypothetical protein [Mesorhizobium sp.]TIM41764.1 MAG: hypothetical protein E5Y55_24100 [Mesorhizobium sp.]
MVDLIRNMIVADRGKPRQFVKGPLPEGVPADTVDRLRRAGALAAEVKAEPEEAKKPAKGKVK